jgi:transposase
MSMKELDRVSVLGRVASGALSPWEAARALGVSERQLRRLLGRYRQEGAPGLAHRSRGRPSNRKLPEAWREAAQALMDEEQYRDYGPTQLAEELARVRGITVSRETMRQWMGAHGHWNPRKAKVRPRQWRERRACVGECLQMDTSIHDWFEGRAEQAVLVAVIDDANSRLYAQFHPGDTAAANMAVLRGYIERHGRPRELYTDRASHFVTTRRPTEDEQLADKPAQTQIQRALAELDIRHILANSPQAKGRIERAFKTLQDRLVKGLRRAGASTIAEANAYLEDEFLAMWEQRFTTPAREPADLHRPAQGVDLDAILSHQQTRRVGSDHTVSYRRQRIQILKQSITPGLRGGDVVIEERLNGTRHVRFRGRYLRVRELPESASGNAAPPSAEAAAKPSRPAKKTPKKRKPAPNHPWRRRALVARHKKDKK